MESQEKGGGDGQEGFMVTSKSIVVKKGTRSSNYLEYCLRANVVIG